MNWIDFVSQHHQIIPISDNSIKIENISCKFYPTEWFDDVITRINSGYIVDTYSKSGKLDCSEKFDSIFHYLGY